MGFGGKGGRSSGRSYGGGSGANIGAVAGASRLFRSGSASLSSSSSSSSGSIDYSKWDEDEKKWLYKYSKDSRCRMAASLLDVCEDVWSPGHPRCNRYREVLADCPGKERGAVAGASRLFRSGAASLSSSSSSGSIDYSKWDEDEKKWLYKYSKDSRCRMAASLLDVCEEVWSPGHSRCNRYREVLADCPGKERAQTRNA